MSRMSKSKGGHWIHVNGRTHNLKKKTVRGDVDAFAFTEIDLLRIDPHLHSYTHTYTDNTTTQCKYTTSNVTKGNQIIQYIRT